MNSRYDPASIFNAESAEVFAERRRAALALLKDLRGAREF